MPKPTLLDALEAATDEDLRTIDSEIEQLQRKLASLSDARRILARRLGVDEPAKRERKAKPETTDPSEFFESVFALLQDRGPTKTAEIAAATGVSGQGAVRENVLELATLAEALDFAAAWCDDPGGLGVLIRPSQGGEP